MDKKEHGKRLAVAMSTKGTSRTTVATATNVNPRTVTNWTTGYSMPTEGQRASLRRLLGEYDAVGDAVEVAVKQSELTEDRQDTVLGFYKRQLREQREERAS